MQILNASNFISCPLPLYQQKIQAGFPSPADDYVDIELDLNEHLVKHPSSTFFVRVTGDSMKDAGITEGNLLVVDKSLEPKDNKIVIAVVNGEFTVKRLKIISGQFYLIPANKDFLYIKLNEDSYIWGVVTAVINKLL